MGRPPHGGGPVFRFTHNEVVEMEMCLQEVNNAIPAREIICALAEKFSASAERAGKIAVQPKQVWNWFQNRRYAQRAKLGKAPGKLSISPMPRDESLSFRNVAPVSAPSGRNSMDTPQVEFEAKSARDGAWYDVAAFLSHRMFETGDPEVRVRFAGFGVEEDEWVNVRRCVRQRSLPCEAAECVAVLPGDLILCFQVLVSLQPLFLKEGKEQALYFDAHVLDAQRRRHDIRGCRCRFLVRYDHDQSEEIVPLRKVCRRPETDYRLQLLQASKASGSVDLRALPKDPSLANASKDPGLAAQRTRKQHKLMDVNTDEVTTVPVPHPKVAIGMQAIPITTTAVENSNRAAPDVPMDDAAVNTDNVDKPLEGRSAGG
ncbi:protein SAWADEE HOMEODOMAIN HOMOLOG 2 isoform X2 [Phoenix dactylifera]|uniref:Protein SAWADEE HOMEODOMAIN HOMOLOG 2 isoform X2 n=1 Tax=Phoenix dactylifera TaxID=42345 RepID=A0A8B8JAV9_PHODC|nr:protein SAWADEE HOMEODOMAIN HOMOLOG 2 isoform X2 [Phoenix dactylifera]